MTHNRSRAWERHDCESPEEVGGCVSPEEVYAPEVFAIEPRM